MSGRSMQDILIAISQQTDLNYAFEQGLKVDTDKKYSLVVNNVTVGEALEQLFSGTQYTYRINNGRVIITPRPVTAANNNERSVTGVVHDENGHPMVGAAVTVPGTQYGVATDIQGRYTLKLPSSGRIVIRYSYVGKRDVEITYSGQREISVTLEDDVTEVDNVVVTGIFNKSRESYTGAVTSISKEDIAAFRGQNLIQTLSNIDPSINVMSMNDFGSNPNALPQINIRGNSTLPMDVEDYNKAFGSVSEYNESLKNRVNTPLIIMDGFEISLTKLMDYNDDDIESINILKDASATAIYGSRGANGVVVIVSKKPEKGKLRINVQTGLTLEIPDLSSYDLLNARELFDLQERIGLYWYEEGGELANDYRQEAYQMRLKDIQQGANTDWLHYPVRTGVSHRHNIRVEGGSDEFRWATSLSYNQIQGAMKGSSRGNFNGGITLSYSYRNLIFQNQLNLGINKAVESPYGSFDTYVKMPSYYMPYDKEGRVEETFMALYDNVERIGNPLYDAGLNTKNETKYTEIINNFSIEWQVLDGLTMRGRFGISKKNNESDLFLPPNHSLFLTKEEYQTDEGYFRRGRYTYGNGNDVNYETSLTVAYSKNFGGKHQLYAGTDFSLQSSETYFYTMIAEGYSNEGQDFFGNGLQWSQVSLPAGIETKSRRVGFTGNVNYTYDNRYYADFSYRVDGSSQFGANNRFAPFWSAGAGWSIHREEFLRNSQAVSNLRLRLSYGRTGSQNFASYQAVPTYEYMTDDKYLNRGGAHLMALGNTILKWQSTDQYNAGLELGLFNNRFNAIFDYYTKTTSGLLSSRDLPRSTGYLSFVDNIGTVKNSGFEASLNGYVIRDTETKLFWMIGAKLAYNKNKITKLSDAVKEQSDKIRENSDVDLSTLFYEGYSQNSIWAVPSAGIDPSTGKELFLDRNGTLTSEWDPSAKVYCGISDPRFRGNLTSMLRYRNFTLNLSFGYHWGGQMYNSTLKERVEVSDVTIGAQNVDRRVLTERWQKPGDVKYFRGYFYSGDTRATSRFVMDDNVFELQSASLQYRLEGTDFLKKAGMQSLTVSVNMSDLFYISTVKRERGTSYPYARRAGVSLSLTF